MKRIAIILSIAALIAFGVIFVTAQSLGRPEKFGRGPGMGHGGFPFNPAMLERIADKLQLSDEQRTQIKQILEDSKTRIQPLMESMKNTHNQLKNLGKDGVFNEEQVTALATQQGNTSRLLVIEKERTKAQIFAVLTAAQREQLLQMREQFENRFRQRMKPGKEN
jgi:Spy/CpxP family protein refolding chaperone